VVRFLIHHLSPVDRPAAAGGEQPPVATPLALKAEVILGLHLVTRHRAVRLAALLATAIAATAASSDPSADRVGRVMVLIGAMLAAVAGARLLAPGAALRAARMVVSPVWLAPLGRVLGAMCVIVPAVFGAGLALMASSHGAVPFGRFAGIAVVYALAVTTTVMALAPAIGASSAASLGFLAVWVGVVPPSAVAALLSGWPPLAHVSLWAWNVFPLPWRALRWINRGGVRDELLLVTWVLLGMAVSGWRLARPAGHTEDTGA
jgi:hypothetical protein